MDSSDPSPPAVPPLDGLDAEKLLAAALRSSPVTVPAQDWDPPAAEEVDGWFGDYQVDRLIGRGAMGAVYHAVHSKLDREVAIKLLPAILAAQPDMVARFEREARALARLSHPNIVGLHDFGRTASGHLYMVMEHVAGADLSRLIRSGNLAVAQALEIIGQVCDALQYAHGHGFVHRDIKPGNILVDSSGRVRIADFGLTKLLGATPAVSGRTLTGAALGTPEYTAPEQLRGGTVDHRADIYSLGVMLYEMLTGDLPRGAWEMPSVLASADARLDEVITRAMQTEPDKRYQHASEVKTAVTAAGSPRPAELPVPAGSSPANTFLALLLFAGAAWIVKLLPTRDLWTGILWCGPFLLAGLYFLFKPRRPGWNRLGMAGLAVLAAAGMTVHTLMTAVSKPEAAEPAVAGQANATAAEPSGPGQSAAGAAVEEAKVTRILSSIQETLDTQQKEVDRLRSAMLELMQEYGIVDLSTMPGQVVPTEGRAAELKELETSIRELESDVEKFGRLSGDELYTALKSRDATIEAFSEVFLKDKRELARMDSSGFGKRHPRRLGLAAQIAKEEEILDKAVENVRKSLGVVLGNLRTQQAAVQSGGATSATSPVAPEKMKKYEESKLRYGIALETLNQMRSSAVKLQMGALSLLSPEPASGTEGKSGAVEAKETTSGPPSSSSPSSEPT
ncbi:MAG: serine/threonine-protein kinase [Verrucomicrobiota bacterium]